MNQIFVKIETIGEFGKAPEERSAEELLNYGIVNIDKPKGPTSHQTSDYVKKIVKVTKSGHSGTLDPQVTGVQPIAIGRATRITEFLLTAPKEYIGIMHLHKDIETSLLKEKVQEFIGKIQQLPPIKSAVKRQLRTREIYEFEILDQDKRDVLFRVKCQAGTYIRKLCHDLGVAMGMGAHMSTLRRTQAGPFTEKDNLVTLNDLADAVYFHKEENNSKLLFHCIQPVEKALKYIKKCWILDTTIQSLTHGRDLAIPGISKLENFKKEETVAILTLKGELVAVGIAQMSAVEINTQDKGLAIKTTKVFLEAISTQ
jgi:H/ACA ribonucleoprotein complex subunit 4